MHPISELLSGLAAFELAGPVRKAHDRSESKKHKPESEDSGSRMYFLVPRTGFEPVLPA